MTSLFWTRKGLVLSVAIMMLSAAAVAVSIGLAFPEPVSNAALGPDWQCTRLAFVLTTCRRAAHADTAIASLGKEADRPCRKGSTRTGRDQR
ncbi:hypothetical protein JQ628_06170 [Bradyrhizobium lablabi]|uniref:hypothetical protein n=1 Tax=Bradyrhizobium lablabi TaxID=722472 RepID=UPI001BABC360|nr:hypothetical protein [Bradyrhizobium lablabi]MBR1121092.1 hypothetical protein [Bradyrhizobium lablabi]